MVHESNKILRIVSDTGCPSTRVHDDHRCCCTGDRLAENRFIRKFDLRAFLIWNIIKMHLRPVMRLVFYRAALQGFEGSEQESHKNNSNFINYPPKFRSIDSGLIKQITICSLAGGGIALGSRSG